MDKIEFFDRWAPHYDTLLPSVFYQAVHVRLLDEVELSAAPHGLEVGCGTGKLLNRLAAHYPDLTGVGLDLAAGMIAQAQKSTSCSDRLQFRQGDVTALPFAPHSFDAVFCSISFLHYPDPVAALKSIATVLKPTGHFYLADFAPPTWWGSEVYRPAISPGGVAFYSAAAREHLGTQAGLRCDRHVHLLGPVLMTQFSPLNGANP